MFDTAIRAGIPLICCTTTDTIHAEAILRHLNSGKQGPSLEVFIEQAPIKDYAKKVAENRENNMVTVIVNPIEAISQAYDAGEIPVPVALMRHLLLHTFSQLEDNLPALHQALLGVTLKEAGELVSLAMALDGSITPSRIKNLRSSRAQLVMGVQIVDTDMPFYQWEPQITDWLKSTGSFLLRHNVDPRLRPRGLLMVGNPGLGKTMSAKAIARNLKVPLFRLDVGSIMNKYVGESEGNLRRALDVICLNSPCVMLVDEVEKLFGGDDDSGVTKNLMAGLLWWLEEHRSQVLTIMTTNDSESLPPELVRQGRIDKRFVFTGPKDLTKFAEELCASMKEPILEVLDYEYLDGLIAGGGATSSHAHISQLVFEWIRQRYVQQT